MKQYRLKSTGQIIEKDDIEEVPEKASFITEDKVNVGEKTDVFGVDINFNIFDAIGRDIELMPENKFFSFKEAAEQYCMDNQSLLSVKDMIEALGINNEAVKKDDKVAFVFNKLKQLAYQKYLQTL